MIQSTINKFMKNRTLDGREASYDYCFNYFKSFAENQDSFKRIAEKKYIEQSCLHIGFYLASWGMLRGSSILLQKNYHYYKKIIEEISKLNPVDFYNVDVDNYNTLSSKEKIFTCSEIIQNSFEHKPTVTQITKIMLGIFGIYPAIDTNFKKNFKINGVDSQSIDALYKFYSENRNEIDNQVIYTLDFDGNETLNKYKKAKIIDMIGWINGM